MRSMQLILATLITLLLCASALAQTTFEARGSAVVPGLMTAYYSSTNKDENYILVTNISSSDVTCRATAYDHDGNDISSKISVLTGNYSGYAPEVSATGTFSLPAANTRLIKIANTSGVQIQVGHMIIEWSSDDTSLRKALIAIGRYLKWNGNYAYSHAIPINNGEAF